MTLKEAMIYHATWSFKGLSCPRNRSFSITRTDFTSGDISFESIIIGESPDVYCQKRDALLEKLTSNELGILAFSTGGEANVISGAFELNEGNQATMCWPGQCGFIKISCHGLISELHSFKA